MGSAMIRAPILALRADESVRWIGSDFNIAPEGRAGRSVAAGFTANVAWDRARPQGPGLGLIERRGFTTTVSY